MAVRKRWIWLAVPPSLLASADDVIE